MATVLEKRTLKAIETLRLIGNRASDVQTPEDAAAVEAVISEALAEAMSRLRKAKQVRKAVEFHLPSSQV